ncbi:MAG TPA: M3 family oligoendopeptidase [Rhizomicrobium sp.]|jgi:oligoendopeptidase F
MSTIDLSRRDALFMGGAALALAPAVARAQAQALLPTKWDLTALYSNNAAWEAEHSALETAFKGLAAYKGRLTVNRATLKEALQAISDLNRRVGRFTLYADLKADEDRRVAANQEKRQTAAEVAGELGEAVAWVNPELLAAGENRIMGEVDADPQMAKFRHHLEDLFRQAPHQLSAEGEALLASAGPLSDSPAQIRGILAASDLPYPEMATADGKVRLDPQGYGKVRTSRVRSERQQANELYFGALKAFEPTLGAVMAAQVQSHIFNAKARRYASSLEAALDVAAVPTGVYRTLLAEAQNGIPVLQRYLALRRRMLGLPDMRYYDLYAPLTTVERRIPLEESRQQTIEALKPLGPDYVQLFTESSAKPWIDAYPRPGKRAGNYTDDSAYDVHLFMLLNYTEDFVGMGHYVHEWGHAMHSLLAQKAQPYETASYSDFIGEIASTMNEQLMAAYLLKTATTRTEKLFFLDRLCDFFTSKFFRQALLAEFELAMHETAEAGKPLSGEQLSGLYLTLIAKYYGTGVTIVPACAIEWADIQHFYFDFYVYQYAVCVSASALFSERVLAGGTADRDSYLNMLRAGGSANPVELIRKGGVDLTTPAPYLALIAKFSRTVDEMEKLVG